MNDTHCPVCKKPMRNLGNISGIIYTSYPEQWDDVYVCDQDKTKKTVRKHGSLGITVRPHVPPNPRRKKKV